MTLAPRQYQMANLLADGYNIKEAANHLGISHATAKQHVVIILRKLNCRRSTGIGRALARKDLPMPLPYAAQELPADLVEAGTLVAAAEATIAGLPPTPLEADLPDIVQAVADLSAAVTAIKGVADTMATILATTRINQ